MKQKSKFKVIDREKCARLLLWQGSSGAKSNPYVGYFAESLKKQGFEVESFTALIWFFGFCKHDALIVHWPESAAQGKHHTLQKIFFSIFVFTLKIYRWRGRNVVWVYHNKRPHDKKHINYQSFSLMVDGVVSPSYTGLSDCMAEYPHLQKVPRAVSRIGCYSSKGEEAADTKKIAISDKEYVFLSFGYIRPYKGLEALISAVKKMERDDVALIICGQAIDQQYVQHLVELVDDSDRVQLDIGFVSDQKLQEYFSSSNAAIFAFNNMLHSSSVIAARSAGLPVLAPAVGSIEEYSKLDPGLYVSKNPVTVDCINKFLDEFSESPPALPEAHFGWESIGSQTADLIWRVLNAQLEERDNL